MADDGRAKVGSGIVAIANNSADGKLGIVVAVTNDLADKVSAVDLVRAGSEASAARAAAAGPTWRRPAAPTARKPSARSRHRGALRRRGAELAPHLRSCLDRSGRRLMLS